jgi:ferritin-like metal-binding protein YciE
MNGRPRAEEVNVSTTKAKLLQYLNEAQATEQALVSTLRGHIAMTPRGEYRDDLEEHLRITRRHAQLVRERIGQLGTSFNPLALGLGLAETIAGQVLALGKMPMDMVRGMSMEEKLLKNAKDECATEALEIATYTALEAVARDAGDTETAQMAARIIREERQFLDRLLQHVPQLAGMVTAAEIEGRKQVDVSKTGAADAARSVRRTARRRVSATAEKATRTARRTSRTARRTAASATRSASRAASRTARTAERRTEEAADNARRTTRTATRTARSRARATTRAATGNTAAANREPWRGYDEQTAAEVIDKVQELPDTRKDRVREYEEANKDRSTVVEATQSAS